MRINSIDHIAINVRNIQKSRDFYGRVLGFKPLQSVDCGEFIIHYFQSPHSSRLELFEYMTGQPDLPRVESAVGLRHLAFEVTDVAAHEQVLRTEGVDIILSTCDLPNLGARVLLFLDPNGVTLEFCEKL
ncbi:MAG TPA: VOC family protein [Anaerolineaceae bacterium]|nr:VOC family protein [Anaerolineaceae bacterium]